MTETTVLLREIHPSFIQEGKVTSQAFRPTPKDFNLLSTYDGDRITPEASYKHYTLSLGYKSGGVLGIITGECEALNLRVIADGDPFPEHVSIDFSDLEKTAIEMASKILKRRSEDRGWLFRPA
jgi:hypothetical protein